MSLGESDADCNEYFCCFRNQDELAAEQRPLAGEEVHDSVEYRPLRNLDVKDYKKRVKCAGFTYFENGDFFKLEYDYDYSDGCKPF